MKPVNVGCIGCGNISGQYLSMQQNFPAVRMVACADLVREKAQAAAAQYGIERVLTPEALLSDPEVEVVLNLTVPKAHFPVSLAALRGGKHVYVEKPLAVSREEGQELVAASRRSGLRIACAPDTFLGAGLQTCRKLIDDAQLGEITAFTAFMISRGHEHWHPDPEFYYQAGGGPMFDMGPYYLTALLNLLGPMKRVAGFTSVAIGRRTITSQPKRGQVIEVETPDHYAGVIEFRSGVVGSIIQSFAMRNADYESSHPIVIYGTKATLKVPDPNGFDGMPLIRHEGGDEGWHEVPHAFVRGYGRSVGLADLAWAIRSGRPHRCSLEQAYCVLDAMQGFRDASENGSAHAIAMSYERPPPMPAHLPFGQLD
jgi:predicted dehydrogenase